MHTVAKSKIDVNWLRLATRGFMLRAIHLQNFKLVVVFVAYCDLLLLRNRRYSSLEIEQGLNKV